MTRGSGRGEGGGGGVKGRSRGGELGDLCCGICATEEAQSHTGVMDYDEACCMHLTPGVVHNFPKAVVA